MWWNNVETKPGTGFPTRWEDQEKYKGGWEKKNGSINLKSTDKKRIVKKMRRVAEERELGDLWTPEEATTIAEYLAAQFQPADQD